MLLLWTWYLSNLHQQWQKIVGNILQERILFIISCNCRKWVVLISFAACSPSKYQASVGMETGSNRKLTKISQYQHMYQNLFVYIPSAYSNAFFCKTWTLFCVSYHSWKWGSLVSYGCNSMHPLATGKCIMYQLWTEVNVSSVSYGQKSMCHLSVMARSQCVICQLLPQVNVSSVSYGQKSMCHLSVIATSQCVICQLWLQVNVSSVSYGQSFCVTCQLWLKVVLSPGCFGFVFRELLMPCQFIHQTNSIFWLGTVWHWIEFQLQSTLFKLIQPFSECLNCRHENWYVQKCIVFLKYFFYFACKHHSSAKYQPGNALMKTASSQHWTGRLHLHLEWTNGYMGEPLHELKTKMFSMYASFTSFVTEINDLLVIWPQICQMHVCTNFHQCLWLLIYQRHWFQTTYWSILSS